VIDESCRAFSVLAADRRITLRSLTDGDVSVIGDQELLRRLMANLLQNALHHTPPGGVVTVAVASAATDVRVRVTDNGAGIADEDRVRIFDRFVQLDASRRAVGTGLGLPIARWIAEAHHGTLVLETSGPGGSTFCVSLPTGL